MIKSSGLLREYWYVVAKSAEISSKKPVKRIIFEIPLVAWRAKSDKPVVMLDRCCHRNAPLSDGKIENDCIVCPYHSWTYDAEGRCVNIPSEGPEQKRTNKRILDSYPVVERDGLIWVWMGQGEPDESKIFKMPISNEPGWKYYYMKTKFDNNITNCVENFMDVPHTISVHKGWFRSERQMCVPTVIERTGDSVEMTYKQEQDSIGFTDRILNPKGLPLEHTDKFFMPNNTRVDYKYGKDERAFIIVSTCTPINPMETVVYTLISYNLGWLNSIAKLFLPFYTRKVIDQDVWIMDVQGKNIKGFGEKKYMSTPADTMHLFIESLRYWAEKGGVDPKPKPLKKEIKFWI